MDKGTSITTQDLILEDDTFEQILKVTNYHDAIMAYYYLDEHNKVFLTHFDDKIIHKFQCKS